MSSRAHGRGELRAGGGREARELGRGEGRQEADDCQHHGARRSRRTASPTTTPPSPAPRLLAPSHATHCPQRTSPHRLPGADMIQHSAALGAQLYLRRVEDREGLPPAAAPAPAPAFLAPAAPAPATSAAFLLGVVAPPMALAIWLESKLGKLRTLACRTEGRGTGEGGHGRGRWSRKEGGGGDRAQKAHRGKNTPAQGRSWAAAEASLTG